MKSILGYTRTSLDTFDERPFCQVDSLVLSSIAYTFFPKEILPEGDWNGIHFANLLKAEYFEQMFHGIWNGKSCLELLIALACSPRFRDTLICGYTQKYDAATEKQFSAVTFRLTPDTSYIAFRGTDSSIIGWKEDFNMSFIRPIPSQLEAAEYVNETIKYSRRKIRLGGHSKGGNLAIYAAVKAKPSLKRRIIAVYNNDGPGFDREMIESEEYRQMLPKIKTIVPEHSVVGMLLEHEEKYMIVKSSQTGIMQHDAMSWQVCGNRFETVKSVDRTSRMLNEALSNWINGLSRMQRSEFVETLFAIITSSGAVNLSDLSADRFNFAGSALKMYSSLDRETKIMLRRMLKSLTGEFDKARKMINNKFK